VIPFFSFPPEVRTIVYTTNAIESLNASVRKAARNKGHFPSNQAATKLIRLALRDMTENRKRPPIAWQAAKAQLAIQFGERLTFND
jgi:transposase-like protein